MDFEPVVERCAEGEQHFSNGAASDISDVDSDIEEIEAEPRPPISVHNASSPAAMEDVPSPSEAEELEQGEEGFCCALCSAQAPLQDVVLMPACPCLFCKHCIQTFVAQQLASWQADCEQDAWSIGCPTQECRGKLTAADCQAIAPQAFARWCEAASEAFLEEDDAFIHCPNPQCGIPIEKLGPGPLPFGLELTGVPELDRTPPYLERSPSGAPLSRPALVHRAKFRYRCSKCCTDFCGGCLTAPYHLGISCKENIMQQHARRCRFCDSLCGEALDASSLLARPVKMLRRESEQERVDTSWCIEKAELVDVLLWAASVCPDQACRQRLEKSCTRMLPCGHHCGGVRGERECLPCLESPCREPHGRPHPKGSLPGADDDCSICFVDSLRQGPAIRLECGHVVHFQCAEKKIAAGYPGPEITFGFLRCPLCSERMRHPSLHKVLAPALNLEAQVRERGRTRSRLNLDQWQRPRAAAGPRGADPAKEAATLEQYQFYLCSRCKVPYYGGERRCAPAGDGPVENAYRADELVCGGCLAGRKGLCTRGHGKAFIEFKCRFCCNVATFFCFGHTHFCDDCHSRRPDRNPALVKPCRGARWCRLGVEHPKQGEEFCLGCAACRSTGQ